MSSIPIFSEFKDWTVKQLVDAASKDESSPWQITIPGFQRRLVWPEKNQKELIASIKKGYPFGSLLLYENKQRQHNEPRNRTYYNLIDGLQRTNALKQYTSNPNRFFSATDVDEIDGTLPAAIARELDDESHDAMSVVRREIAKWVQSVESFTETSGWEASGLIKHLVSEVRKVDRGSDKFYSLTGRLNDNGLFRRQIQSFLQAVREQADISTVKIPIIIFHGPSSELPSIFFLLNTKGTMLSKYEVFAARWLDYKCRIENPTIRAAIWKKYQALEDASFTSDAWEDAPDETSRINRQYTIFEYLFGFGQYLSEAFPRLFEAIPADEPSSVGFNLVSACIGLQIKNMNQLPEHISLPDLSSLEVAILESTEFVNSVLQPILSVNQHGRKNASIYHSEYQIISMIATAYMVRYDGADAHEIDGWQSNRDRLSRNLLMRYLYDILRLHWRGSGDSTMYDTVAHLRYLNSPPSRRQWESELDRWFTDEQITFVHKRRYVRDTNPEILLLRYIYVHKLSVFENAKTYHVEHVIPVNRLTALLLHEEDKLAMNMVGNLALLESGINIKKGDSTFVEYVESQRGDGKLSEDEYQRQRHELAEQLICPVDIVPQQITRGSYDDFVTARFDHLKQAFLDSWHDYIPADPPA